MTSDEILASARTQLARIEAAGNSALALEPDVAEDIQRLADFVESDGGFNLEHHYVLGWLYWHRHRARPGTHEGESDQVQAIVTLRQCFVVGTETLPGPLLRYLAAVSFDMAVELLERAVGSGDRNLLSGVVSLWMRMLTLDDPVHPEDLPMYWSNLGVALIAQFNLDGAEADLTAAINAFERAVDLAPESGSDRARYLANLSGALFQRAELTGSARDRDQAVALGRASAQLSSSADSDRVGYISNLGSSLLATYEQTGEDVHLTAAITAFRDALEVCEPDHAGRAAILSNLGNALLRRSELTGAPDDLDGSVQAHRAAVDATAPGHPYRSKRLANLSTALRARFGRLGRDADLDDSVEMAREALALLPPDSPDRPMTLFGLGCVMYAKFTRSGALADLDAGIGFLREAVSLLPSSHVGRGALIGQLGGFLATRYQWTEAVVDLDMAIAIGREALAATPEGSVHRPAILSFLGTALRDRAELPETEAALLDEAVELGRQAVAATPPDHQERARHLNGLAVSLSLRAERTGSERDLDEAIEVGKQATAPGGEGPDRAGWLSNLSTFLRDRAARTGSKGDLDEALGFGHAALSTVPADHHLRAMLLMNMAGCLRDDFDRSGTKKALELARRMYVLAAGVEAATPSVRIRAMREAASLTATPLAAAYWSVRQRVRDVAGMLEDAVRLLPEVAPRQLHRADQQRQLAGLAGLASDAAAFALLDERRRQSRAQRAARALAVLEHGRGILLSQALATRSDLTDLRGLRPDLADRYQRLRNLLDQAPDEAVDALNAALAASSGPALAGPDRSKLAKEFADTMADIRGLDGFAGFMLPPPLPELARAAGSGAVVFNVSSLRSDAIVLKSSGEVDYVPLLSLPAAALEEKIELFRQAQLLRMGRSAASHDTAGQAERTLLDILEWLWDVAAEPALEALGYDTPHPWGFPEVKWVPGGLLGQLPIHAAGHHRAVGGGPPRTVMDLVISSYSPTIRALHYAHQQVAAARRTQPVRSLVVAMPSTPGAGELPGVAEAAERLRAILPGAALLMPLPYPDGVDPATVSGKPTRTEVLDRLDGCDIVHFACHGVSDPVDPSQSRLLLSDCRTAPLTVADLTPVRLDKARLAYLSACSTALNEVTELADESIHLASAFQLAGFPHVIATLWEVDAGVAGVVASEFYRRLATDGGRLNIDRAAEVIHEIVRDLRRDEPDSPFAWAGYLHAGS